MNVNLLLSAMYDKLLSKIQAVEAVRGEKGDKGDTGEAGPTGAKGPKGDKGDTGPAGVDGKDGKDGTDGVDGKDGVSVQDATVDFDGHLVLTLSNGEEIDAGSVKDLNEAQAPNVYNISMGNLSSNADLRNAQAKTITSNHTTSGSQILKVTSSAVINLNSNPQDRETVIVNCRTNDKIDIVGYISVVNLAYYNVAEYNVDDFGAASLVVEQDNTTIHLVYIKEFKEWLAV